MIVSLKDSLKLIAISVICCCAVFVCTFFINYYVDAVAIKDLVAEEMFDLYNAQLATAKISCALSGCCLALVSVFTLIFYIKLYVDGHAKQLGILKAMGYSNGQLALRFFVFGLSVFIGTAVGFGMGYATAPLVYRTMTIEGLEIPLHFHAWLPVALIVAPTAAFSLLSCGYAYFALRRPVGDMLRGKTNAKIKKRIQRKGKEGKERPFLLEMCLKTLGAKKSLAFFVAFACFCFSAMIQMGASMYELNSGAMGPMILVIGIVLAVTTLFIAITALVNGNVKNVAVMKAFGYSKTECAITIFGGFVPFALIGFGLGTGYQYLILRIMVDLFFKEFSLTFGFDVATFFITFAAFVVLYAAVMLLYSWKLGKISVKEIMAEN